MKETWVTLMTLFLSLGTLICCVLPVILVSVGLGVVMASLISHVPLLVTLSRYKLWLFIVSAVLLMTTAWLLWRSSRSCPTDPKLAALCSRLMHWNKFTFWIAAMIWVIGFVTTYVIIPLWILMEG